jgi:hypothetical protein
LRARIRKRLSELADTLLVRCPDGVVGHQCNACKHAFQSQRQRDRYCQSCREILKHYQGELERLLKSALAGSQTQCVCGHPEKRHFQVNERRPPCCDCEGFQSERGKVLQELEQKLLRCDYPAGPNVRCDYSVWRGGFSDEDIHRMLELAQRLVLQIHRHEMRHNFPGVFAQDRRKSSR